MDDGSQVLPGLSPVPGQPVRSAFDGASLTSDAGVLVRAEIERRLAVAERVISEEVHGDTGEADEVADPARIGR